LWLSSHIARANSGAKAQEGLRITHGIASGDVTAHSAVIWARASGPAQMHVEYDTEPGFARPKEGGTAAAGKATDYTANIKLLGLAADTSYFYRVWFSSRKEDRPSTASQKLAGTFTTAPDASTRRAVRFVFSGDLGGGRYCRHVDRGYAIFSRMKQLSPRFFIANGDMIYADHHCPAAGPKGRQNVPGDFPRVTDPAVNWMDPAQVRPGHIGTPRRSSGKATPTSSRPAGTLCSTTPRSTGTLTSRPVSIDRSTGARISISSSWTRGHTGAATISPTRRKTERPCSAGDNSNG
jgi:hypothetical protein